MWPGATDEESEPQSRTGSQERKSKVRIYDTFPIRNFDHWIEESKTHLWLVDVDGRIGKRAASSVGLLLWLGPGFGGDALAAVWAPDGQSVVFVATENDTVAARAAVASHLWQVSAAGGDPKRLTPDGWDYRRAGISSRWQGTLLHARRMPSRSSIS